MRMSVFTCVHSDHATPRCRTVSCFVPALGSFLRCIHNNNPHTMDKSCQLMAADKPASRRDPNAAGGSLVQSLFTPLWLRMYSEGGGFAKGTTLRSSIGSRVAAHMNMPLSCVS